MKILYIAHDRRAAELAAVALRTVGPDVAVAWAASLGGARRWIDENRGVAALIVEVESDDPSCESFIGEIRGLGVTAPVIVASVTDPAPPLPSLKAVADQIITKDRSFLNDLPYVVTRALHTAPPVARPARRLVRVVYVGDAALARECLGKAGGSTEVVEAVLGPTGTFDPLPVDAKPDVPLPFDVLLIEHGYPGVETFGILKDIAARKLHVPVVIVAEWNEELAVLALKLGAVDYVVKSKTSFRALLFRLNRLLAQPERRALETKLAEAEASHQRAEQLAQREAELIAKLGGAATNQERLERRLADADAALRNAERRTEAEQHAAKQQAIERQAQTEAGLARETTNRQALEQRLADATLALERARQQHASEMVDAATRLTQSQAKGDARLAEAATATGALESKLADTVASLTRMTEQAAADRQAALDETAKRRTTFDAEISEEVARRETLAKQLADAEARLAQTAAAAEADRQRAEHQRTSELAAASATLAEHQERADARSAQAAAALDALQAKLVEGAAALQRAEQQASADRQAAADASAKRQAKFDADISEEVARRQTVAKQLADADAARQHAEQHHASELTAAAARLSEHQTQAEARLAQAAASADALRAKLVEGAAALQLAEQQAAADRQTAAEEAAQRRAKFDTELTEEVARRQTLAKQLAEAEARLTQTAAAADARLAQTAADADALGAKLVQGAAALQLAEQQAAADRQTAAEEAAERRAKFDTELTEVVARRETLAKQLADAEERFTHATAAAEARLAHAAADTDALRAKLVESAANLQRAEQQAATDRQAAAGEAAERRAKFEAELTAEVARRETLAKQLADAQTDHQHAEQQHAWQTAATTARQHEYQTQHKEYQTQAEARLTEIAADADALRAKLIDGAAALQRAEQQAGADRQAAAEASAESRATFDAELAQAVARGETLATQLADVEARLVHTAAAAESERQRAAEQHATAMAAATGRLTEYQTQVEARFTQAAAAAKTLQGKLADGAAALAHAEQQAAADRQAAAEQAAEQQIAAAQAAQRRAELETELKQEVARRQKVEAEFADARAASEQTERRFMDEVAAMRQRAREHEARLEEHAARERGEWQSTLAERQERIRHLQVEGEETLARVAQERATERASLAALAAERGAELQKQIDDSRSESRRRFDYSPVSLCRSGRDGAMTHVNPALARLLGYATPAELQKVDFAATVFESGDELQWLIDRCLASGSAESVETTWKRKDGSRIIVRVLAVAATPDSIDLAAEDITTFRALEEKLKNSQRMEAVARYASEVAVTCDKLLSDVKQEGQQWLTTIDSDAARYHGELLLDQVTRAAGFLRQLKIYGNEQKNVPDLVDLNKVLRDLEPVLKRVAGGDIELVVPKVTTPLDLDVEAERVERMLVNVAAYGRERMPFGGRLTIEVASVVVDRKFVAKYPNVRSGAHVLLTVTEKKAEKRADFAAVEYLPGANDTTSASDKPGVDLGVLQALVNDCGGHLWMMAEPSGDMVLKIHLPRRALERAEPQSAKRPRGSWIKRVSGARQ